MYDLGMATAVMSPHTCKLTVNVFSGARKPFAAATDILLTVIDGNGKQIYRDFKPAASVAFTLPFHDNFADNYTIVAWAKGYKQAGIPPVTVQAGANKVADIMLIKDDGGMNFHDARWETLAVTRPAFTRVLSATETYTDCLENKPLVMACILNLFTAMEQVHLAGGTP
jgi:hypothetical protein